MPNQAADRTHSLRRAAGLTGLVALAASLALAPRARAAKPAPVEARSGIDLAAAAARAWSADAVLVYLENDEDVDARGAAARWAYVFFSPATHQARAYSVRAGKIMVAENLDMKLEAPPVGDGWIDSGVARAAAEAEAQRTLRGRSGHLDAMLLMRGAFDDADPDRATWTCVYTVPGAPALFVVVDATEGKVRRTWRG